MARHTTISVGNSWTELTANDVTELTFMVKSGSPIYVAATVGQNAPTDTLTSLEYQRHQGELLTTLAKMAPGLAGANRIYAKAVGDVAQVFVSHA